MQKQNPRRESHESAELAGAGGGNKPWLSHQEYSINCKELGGGVKHEMPASTGQDETPVSAVTTYVSDGSKKDGQTFEM